MAGLQPINNQNASLYREYDELNRLTLERDALNDDTRYTYDLLGNITQITDAKGQVTQFKYNGLGWLIETIDPVLESPDKTDRVLLYDEAGNVLLTEDRTGRQRRHTYDLLNRRILSNGVQTDYRFDADNRLTGLKNLSAKAAVVEDLSYQRDSIGNITRIADASGKTVQYTYDPLYRLRTVDSTDNTEDRGYTYDSVGNRLTHTENGTTTHYGYGTGNRLLTIRSGSASGPLLRQFTYNDAGRLLAKRDGSGNLLYTVTYNGKGRAGEITAPDGPHVFSYDANDYRIEKDGDLYHLEGEHLESVYNAGGVLREKYLRGVVVDEIVNGYRYPTANANDKINYSFHHDHLNSVTALSGHEGSVKETWRYDAFGKPLTVTLPGTGNSLLYTGREYDQATGLYYYRARYYDPEIGRFISEDPKGFGAGVNFYAYVSNNPINFNDPMGLWDMQVNVAAHAPIGPLIAWGGERQLFSVGKLNNSWSIKGPAAYTDQEISLGSVIDVGANIKLSDLSNTGGQQAGISHSVLPEFLKEAVGKYFDMTVTYRKELDPERSWMNPLKYIDAIGVGGELGLAFPWAVDMPMQLGPDPANMVPYNPDFSSISPSFGGASGGFVIYPNKPNTNVMRQVYSK